MLPPAEKIYKRLYDDIESKFQPGDETYTSFLRTAAIVKQNITQFSDEELLYALQYCFEDLPEKYKLVLELSYFQNEKAEDIKAIICMSESTVRNRLNYGLSLLKKRLYERLALLLSRP